MDDIEAAWLSSNISGNVSYLNNYTGTAIYPIYIFTPTGVTAKRLLCLFLITIGAAGFLGNCLIFHFLWQKPAANPIESSRFVANLNLYLRSLSLSDLLSPAVSLPLLCIQISFDVFQSGWPCKLVRYINLIFPIITLNNLFAISLEKYLSTRTVPRLFSFSKMRRVIICAWVLGLVVMLFPGVAFDGVRVDLNQTHYTVICSADQHFYPFRISFIILPLQYVLPSIIVTYINICLIKTVCERGRRQVGEKVTNAFKAQRRINKIKGITLLISLSLAFIIPYFFYIANIAYTQIVKPRRDFTTDYFIRYASGGIAACLSGLINFIIYFAQRKDFREFLRKRLFKRNDAINQPLLIVGERKTYCLATSTPNVVGRKDNVIELKEVKISNPKR